MTATFSTDRIYRYDLTRDVGGLGGSGTAVWIMLNPSTADETTNDATVRRVIGFSRRAAVSTLVVVNLYALRSTDPGMLIEAHEHGVDVIGPDNAETIRRHVADSHIAVAAWGSWWENYGRRRSVPRLDVEQIVNDCGRRLYCVGTTDGGTPRHPLYVPKQQPLVPFT